MIDGLLLMLMDERLLVERRLLHVLLTVTVLLVHWRTWLLLMMEIFHAITLTTRQSFMSARTKHQWIVNAVVNVLKVKIRSLIKSTFLEAFNFTWACARLWWIAESDDVLRQLDSGGLRYAVLLLLYGDVSIFLLRDLIGPPPTLRPEIVHRFLLIFRRNRSD